MKKENKLWLNILKILASFCVVVNHTCVLEVGNTNTDILFHCIQLSLSKIAVPIFIMITAVLLIDKKIDFKYIRKKIIRIVIPLIFLSIFIYNLKHLTFDFGEFIQKFFSADIIHPYWYLYMLIGLYLMIPILNKMISNLNKKDFLYITVISLIIPTAIYTIEKIFNFSLHYSFTISFFTSIISYYIAGIYITKITLNKKNRNIAVALFIVPILFFIIYMFLNSTSNNISYVLDDYNLITTSLPSISIFYLIRYFFENKEISLKIQNKINKISNLTFGLYLFHQIYSYTIYKLDFVQYIYDINNILGTIVLEILVIIIGLFITYLLRKNSIIKKIL